MSKLLDINSEILISIITAAITAYATVANFTKKYKGEYVTKERQTWRTEIRKRFEEVAYTMDIAKLQKFVVFMNTRLNPYDVRDVEIIENLKDIEKQLKDRTEEKLDEKWEELSVRISLLLKHDWERIKKESKSSGLLLKLCYYIFLIVVCNQFIQPIKVEYLTDGFVTLNSSIFQVLFLFVSVIIGDSLIRFIIHRFNLLFKLIETLESKRIIKANKVVVFYLVNRDFKEYMKWRERINPVFESELESTNKEMNR